MVKPITMRMRRFACRSVTDMEARCPSLFPTITKTQWSDRGFTWLTGLAPVGGEFHRLRIVWLKRRKLHIVLPNAACLGPIGFNSLLNDILFAGGSFGASDGNLVSVGPATLLKCGSW